jgi:YbbR domain-containing protein
MKQLNFVDTRSTKLFFKHILRKVFLEDWTLKLSAALITVAIWFGVSYSNKKSEARMQADVVFRPADNAILTEASLSTVARQDWTVKVSGDDRDIADLYNARTKIPITVDLTDEKPGDLFVQLTPDSVSASLPKGVKLDDIQPNRITISVEPLEEKELPVNAMITGRPADGFEIYNTIVTPAHIGLSGPKSYVETLDFVPTESRDIAGAKQDMTFRQVPTRVANTRTVIFNAGVDVIVKIGEKRVERTFALTSASGKHVTAVLYGPRSLLTKAKPTDFKVDIVKGDNGSDTPQLTLPDVLQGTVEIRTLKLG